MFMQLLCGEVILDNEAVNRLRRKRMSFAESEDAADKHGISMRQVFWNEKEQQVALSQIIWLCWFLKCAPWSIMKR